MNYRYQAGRDCALGFTIATKLNPQLIYILLARTWIP